MPAYTSAKAAIEGLTVSLARSYGKHQIRVNCIVPGQVWTPRQIRDILTPEYEQFMNEKQCIPGKILPEDVAQLAFSLDQMQGACVPAEITLLTQDWGIDMNQIDLKNRKAVVTGGAQGIGRAIAERLLDSGASVSIWDRDESLLKKTSNSLSSKGMLSLCNECY